MFPCEVIVMRETKIVNAESACSCAGTNRVRKCVCVVKIMLPGNIINLIIAKSTQQRDISPEIMRHWSCYRIPVGVDVDFRRTMCLADGVRG